MCCLVTRGTRVHCRQVKPGPFARVHKGVVSMAGDPTCHLSLKRTKATEDEEGPLMNSHHFEEGDLDVSESIREKVSKTEAVISVWREAFLEETTL